MRALRHISRSVSTVIIAGVTAILISTPGLLYAQRDLAPLDHCATFGVGSEANRRCNLVVQSIDILQPPIGMAMSGGNPVPGTASTLGMRLGSVPRISLGGRISILGVDIPAILETERGGKTSATLPGLSIDASIGLLQGSSPLPTVGGLGSLDLIASAGFLPLPTGAGFSSGSPFSWALGLRGGIFRESFTLPGISISALYRHTARSTFGDPELIDSESFIDMSVASLGLRAAISKRIAGVGLTAGAGYDRYSSNGSLGFTTSPFGGLPEVIDFSRIKNDKASLFTNLSYTLFILHLVAELGWQQGSGKIDVPLPPNAKISTGGRIFGGIAARISI